MEKLYSRKEAASMLGISLNALDLARAAGAITFVQYVPNGNEIVYNYHNNFVLKYSILLMSYNEIVERVGRLITLHLDKMERDTLAKEFECDAYTMEIRYDANMRNYEFKTVNRKKRVSH